MPKICVIGAGGCGLVATQTLIDHGFEVECLERQDAVGGNWYFGSPHSPMYASASMISSKRMTQFAGFPMPASYPPYPRHAQVLDYLRSFAEHFGLAQHIRFGSSVSSVTRSKLGWQVQLDGEPTPREYDGVVVASGHHSCPNVPDFAADFAGEVVHSRDYRTPSRFDGQRVLVVGAGNSGCDIAAELGRYTRHCSISLRRGYHFLPKFLLGAPLDRCGETLAKYRLPWFLYRFITAIFLRIAVGPLSRYGLPSPADRLFETHPIINSQLLEAIGHGRVAVRTGIQSVTGNTVTFTDQTSAEFDAMLCATGYKLHWPFLSKSVVATDHAAKFPLRLFHPDFNGLYFVGLIQPNGAIWPLAQLQSQLVAQHLKASAAAHDGRPEALHQLQTQILSVGERSLSGGLRYTAAERHALEVEFYAYRRTMQRLLAGCARSGSGSEIENSADDTVEPGSGSCESVRPKPSAGFAATKPD